MVLKLSEIYGFNLVRGLGHNALDFIVEGFASFFDISEFLGTKTELIENTELWSTWKLKMPVIMNYT